VSKVIISSPFDSLSSATVSYIDDRNTTVVSFKIAMLAKEFVSGGSFCDQLLQQFHQVDKEIGIRGKWQGGSVTGVCKGWDYDGEMINIPSVFDHVRNIMNQRSPEISQCNPKNPGLHYLLKMLSKTYALLITESSVKPFEGQVSEFLEPTGRCSCQSMALRVRSSSAVISATLCVDPRTRSASTEAHWIQGRVEVPPDVGVEAGGVKHVPSDALVGDVQSPEEDDVL